MYSKSRVYGAADSIKPYVERAMSDDKLRSDIFRAFRTANDVYHELMSDRGEPVRIATRVATDDDVRDKLREAIEDLRSASDRLKGEADHYRPRNTVLLITGITLGLLYNPVTGPETRRFIREMISGPSTDYGDSSSTNGGRGARKGGDPAASALDGRLRAAGAAPGCARDGATGVESVRARDVGDREQDRAWLRRGVAAALARRPAEQSARTAAAAGVSPRRGTASDPWRRRSRGASSDTGCTSKWRCVGVPSASPVAP